MSNVMTFHPVLFNTHQMVMIYYRGEKDGQTDMSIIPYKIKKSGYENKRIKKTIHLVVFRLTISFLTVTMNFLPD